MRINSHSAFLVAIAFAAQLLVFGSIAKAQVDTDRDGLLDLLDVPGFDPNHGNASFSVRGIQDLDGANLLTNPQSLDLTSNQITGIESSDFEGLANLQSLSLAFNQITSIESGAFHGLTNLSSLFLTRLQMTNLNLKAATFEDLTGCVSGIVTTGLCVFGEEISGLILDDATLSRGSFDAIVGQTYSITDVSLVGLNFSDSNPDNLTNLLGITTLDNVTVDQALFDLYSDEFKAFAAIDGKRLTLVPGLCDTNRDGTCDVSDIDAMTLVVVDGTATADELTGLIKRPSPAGFHTYFGDANLDGEFDSGDLAMAFAAGTYDLGIIAGWASGDFDGNGRFDSGDLVLALADGGYEQGHRAAAVPEPSTFLLLLLALGSVILSRKPVRRPF